MAIRFSSGTAPTLGRQRVEAGVSRRLAPVEKAAQFGSRAISNAKTGRPTIGASEVSPKDQKFKPVGTEQTNATFSEKSSKDRLNSASATAAYGDTLENRRQTQAQEKYQAELSAWEDRQRQRQIAELEASNRQLEKLGRGVTLEGTGPSRDGSLTPVITTKTGNSIVDAALSLVGTTYSYGGGGYDRATSYGTARGDQNVVGVDCSGLTSYAYYQAGINIPRHSVSQVQSGHKTSVSNAKPGDIIGWYNSDGSIMKHVGIYAGDGKIIEANSSRGEVVYHDLWGSGRAFAVSLG